MFLTRDEIKELTGYAYRSRQIDWLRKNRWKFEVNAQLIPKVARSYFDQRMGGLDSQQKNENNSNILRPNFGALNKLRAR